MKTIFDILKTKNYSINDDLIKYYTTIDDWKKWWQGYNEKFHKHYITDVNNKQKKLTRVSMRMAKTVAEDWANLLLTDKTYIQIASSDDGDKVNPTQIFLSGDSAEQNEGVLGLSKFWKSGNALIEKVYALGTGMIYLMPHKPKLINGEIKAENIKIKYIKDASMIIPLSYDNDEITEVAVYSYLNAKGAQYLYLQLFLVEGDKYKIVNEYYKITNNELIKTFTPNGEAEYFICPTKPFFIISPNIENNVLLTVPMGLSAYANAIDNLKGCDLSFDNLYNDFQLGRKKVFMSQNALSVVNGEDGKPYYSAEESVEQTFYAIVGEQMPGEQRLFAEYNPAIRTNENKEGIQFFLELLSFKCGLGTKRYSFNDKTMATATEVKASNKELVESVWKQRLSLQDVLVSMTRSVLILGKEWCNSNVDVNAKISIKFDDSMFSDEDAQRLRDMQEVNSGIMAKWEFRVKWYGEDEKVAKAKIKELESTDDSSLSNSYA